MKIENASKEDASLIADAILEAVGAEITSALAGKENSIKDVHDLFMRLAEREDTQYSYRNSRIARSETDEAMGVCISYDGENLKRLRVPFFHEANAVLGWRLTDEEIDALPGETEPDEFYLDTLMTLPAYRDRGVARALITDAGEKARKAGKPLGLLCDLENTQARRLYESVGFREVGLRPFAGHDMAHMQLAFPKLHS